MCYRDEKQADAGDKLREQIKDAPKFIKQFFESKPKLKSTMSHVQYWSNFKQFFNYLIEKEVIEKKSISEITEDDIRLLKKTNIDQYLIYSRDVKKNSGNTISLKLNSLRSLFSYFVDDEITLRDITKNVAIDKPKQKPIKFATIEDRNLLIHNIEHRMKNEFDKVRNIAIVHSLMGSGVRIQELIGLDMKHIHLEDETPWIFVNRKGGDTDVVPITHDAKMAIEEYLLIRYERVTEDNKHILFISERRTRLSENTVRGFMTKYSDGVINPHMLRKGLGMLIMNSPEGSIKMVSDQLGNSELTASRYYAKTDVSIRANVMNGF